ncbi:MAG: Excinuclease subunit UvrC, partial [Patescibacteria group bacterium]|nr:Excinuclease subunit UvrC [Patescibacteria group bacterium]
MLNDKLKKKISLLPKEPGVYFHKDKSSEIIYVGKAASLNNRVRQYFQKSRLRDIKTDALVAEIVDVDWIVVASESEALFLEAEMIRRYMPRFNILLRDDKSLVYVRINKKAKAPSVTYTRRPLDDDAEYFGPFLSARPVKKSLQYLRKIFPYSTHTTLPSRGCLQTHLGLCPGPETAQYDRKQYLSNLNKLSLYLRGERLKVVKELQKEMALAASDHNFEQAAKLRNQLRALQSLRVQIIFSDKENLDLSKDHALFALTNLLSLSKPPKRIEGYDISHMSGTDTVASMVVFDNGVSNKSAYRKFKMRTPGNDDFA